jgi:hypothetical protein
VSILVILDDRSQDEYLCSGEGTLKRQNTLTRKISTEETLMKKLSPGDVEAGEL